MKIYSYRLTDADLAAGPAPGWAPWSTLVQVVGGDPNASVQLTLPPSCRYVRTRLLATTHDERITQDSDAAVVGLNRMHDAVGFLFFGATTATSEAPGLPCVMLGNQGGPYAYPVRGGLTLSLVVGILDIMSYFWTVEAFEHPPLEQLPLSPELLARLGLPPGSGGLPCR